MTFPPNLAQFPVIAALTEAIQSPQIWLAVILVAAWLGAILGIAEWLYRQRSASSEGGRKIVHIGAGQVMLLAWWLAIPGWVIQAAAVLAGAIAIASYNLPILPSVNSVGRHSWGTLFYAISIGVLTTWFWPLGRPEFAVLGILVMAWGDGMAAIVGQRWGRHRYRVGGIQKSWEGSLAMAWVSAIVAIAILRGAGTAFAPALLTGTIVALFATTLELLSWRGIDNLTVPLGSAAIAYGCLTQLS
jgi:phytol kinase